MNLESLQDIYNEHCKYLQKIEDEDTNSMFSELFESIVKAHEVYLHVSNTSNADLDSLKDISAAYHEDTVDQLNSISKKLKQNFGERGDSICADIDMNFCALTELFMDNKEINLFTSGTYESIRNRSAAIIFDMKRKIVADQERKENRYVLNDDEKSLIEKYYNDLAEKPVIKNGKKLSAFAVFFKLYRDYAFRVNNINIELKKPNLNKEKRNVLRNKIAIESKEFNADARKKALNNLLYLIGKEQPDEIISILNNKSGNPYINAELLFKKLSGIRDEMNPPPVLSVAPKGEEPKVSRGRSRAKKTTKSKANKAQLSTANNNSESLLTVDNKDNDRAQEIDDEQMAKLMEYMIPLAEDGQSKKKRSSTPVPHKQSNNEEDARPKSRSRSAIQPIHRGVGAYSNQRDVIIGGKIKFPKKRSQSVGDVSSRVGGARMPQYVPDLVAQYYSYTMGGDVLGKGSVTSTVHSNIDPFSKKMTPIINTSENTTPLDDKTSALGHFLNKIHQTRDPLEVSQKNKTNSTMSKGFFYIPSMLLNYDPVTESSFFNWNTKLPNITLEESREDDDASDKVPLSSNEILGDYKIEFTPELIRKAKAIMEQNSLIPECYVLNENGIKTVMLHGYLRSGDSGFVKLKADGMPDLERNIGAQDIAHADDEHAGHGPLKEISTDEYPVLLKPILKTDKIKPRDNFLKTFKGERRKVQFSESVKIREI